MRCFYSWKTFEFSIKPYLEKCFEKDENIFEYLEYKKEIVDTIIRDLEYGQEEEIEIYQIFYEDIESDFEYEELKVIVENISRELNESEIELKRLLFAKSSRKEYENKGNLVGQLKELIKSALRVYARISEIFPEIYF